MVDIATLGVEVKSRGISETTSQLDGLANKGKAAEGQQDKLANSNKKLGSSFESLQKYIGMVQGAFAALGIGMVIKDFISAAMEMDKLTRQFTVFTGSATLAGKEMQFVKEQANRLGLDMRSLTASYALFMNAIKGTANEGQKGRDAFVGISEGMAAVGMAADKQGAAWAQLNQGIMKGKFEMEDLKAINEAGLPIFKLMADALGVTTAEFMKMQAEGRVLANDVLPKLGTSMHEAYGVAALEGAMSAQGAINKMNNAMLESKAVAGSALMPVFTDLVTDVFTPLVKLIGDAVKGLQSMAAAAALVVNQLMGGFGSILSGKAFTKDGYREAMAESLENEAIYKASMEKIWKAPTSSDYSAAERMKQGGGKISADVDDEAVKAAEKARQREIDDIARRDVLATDIWNKEQRRLSETAYWLSDHDKGILKINNDYEQIIETQAKSVPFSKEQLATLEQMRVTAIARFAAEEKYNSSIKDAEQSEKDRLELLRLQSKELDRQAQLAFELADLNNQIKTDAAQLKADQTQNGMFGNGTSTFGSIDAQLAADKAAIEERASAEQIAIQIRIDGIQAGRDADLEAIDTAHQSRMAAIDAENKAKFFDQPQKLAAAAAASASSEKEYQSKISGIKTAAAAQSNAMIGALNKALTLSVDKELQKQLTAEEKASRAKMQLVASYASFGAEAFTLLAETQEQSSRSGFETAKAFNIAAATMSTAAAIMNAFATQPWPQAPIAAGLAAATGVIQIANIASTSFEGGGSVSAPSGSFAAGGSSAGGSTGLSNLPTQIASIQDSQTAESLAALTASTDNAALVIGRLSKSIDSLNSLFQSGGAGYSLANNAPGKFTGASEIATTMSVLKDIGKGYVNAVAGLFTLNFSKMMDGISGFVGGVKSAVFGGSWKTTGAGISLGMDSGSVDGRTYITQKKDGGLFGSDKKRTTYTDNSELGSYVQSMIDPYVSDIVRMAATLGTTAATETFTAASINIATAGRKPEDIAADVEKWATGVLQGMALTVDGLQDVIGSYDDAYEALKTLNDALVSTNEAFALVGKTALQGSLDNAQWAISLQSIFGGMDSFNTAMDNYFTTMYTDTEQAAMKAAAATIDVNNAFAEMGLAIPSTNAAFNALRNSLDITTESGSALFASLTLLGPTFAEMTKQSEALAQAFVDSISTISESAAAAIRDIQNSTLSAESPEARYARAQLEFTYATPETAGELGKSLLDASRSMFASGEGYMSDYSNVMNDLTTLAGLDTTVDPNASTVAEIKTLKAAIVDLQKAIVDKLTVIEAPLVRVAANI